MRHRESAVLNTSTKTTAKPRLNILQANYGVHEDFQAEHVGQHGHAARHPLAGTAEFGVVELRHAAVTVDHRFEQAQDGVWAEAVPLGQIVDRLLAGGGKRSHRENSW